MSDVIEVLKLGNLSSQKNLEKIEKESDKRNCMDTSNDKDSDERDHMNKKFE